MSSGQKLFKFYRDQMKEDSKNKRLFFYRVNRWRFDPYDMPRIWKSNSRGGTSMLKIRYVFAGFLLYRVTLHYIIPPAH